MNYGITRKFAEPAWSYKSSVAGLLAGAGDTSLLAGETDGLAIDFTSSTYFNTSTWAQLWNQVRTASVDAYSSPHSFYTQSGTSPKVVKVSSTQLGWSPHNYLLQSQTLNTTWSAANSISVSANSTTAPDGSSTADTLSAANAFADHSLSQSLTFPGAGIANTFSVYVKSSTHNYVQLSIIDGGAGTSWFAAVFDLSNPSAATQTANGGTNGATVLASSITSIGSGWYRISVSGSFSDVAGTHCVIDLANSATPTNVSYSNIVWSAAGTEAIFAWGAQLNRGIVPTAYIATTSAAVNGLPISYGEGLWVEPAATNVCVRSEELDSVSWSVDATTVTANSTVAPDGSTTADTLTANSGNALHRIQQGGRTTSGTVTYSVYLKEGTHRYVSVMVDDNAGNGAAILVDLQTGTILSTALQNGSNILHTSSSITLIGNSWYRVTITVGVSSTSVNTVNIELRQNGVSSVWTPSWTAAGTETVICWGAQLELGSVATSYIPTQGSSVTRAVDDITCQVSTFPVYTTIPYSWWVEVVKADKTDDQDLLVASSTGDDCQVGNYIASSVVNMFVYRNTLTEAQFSSATSLTNNTAFKVASRANTNDMHFAVNGTLASGGPDTSGTPPIVSDGVSQLIFGGYWAAHVGGVITFRKIVIVPRAYTNTELQSKST